MHLVLFQCFGEICCFFLLKMWLLKPHLIRRLAEEWCLLFLQTDLGTSLSLYRAFDKNTKLLYLLWPKVKRLGFLLSVMEFRVAVCLELVSCQLAAFYWDNTAFTLLFFFFVSLSKAHLGWCSYRITSRSKQQKQNIPISSLFFCFTFISALFCAQDSPSGIICITGFNVSSDKNISHRSSSN